MIEEKQQASDHDNEPAFAISRRRLRLTCTNIMSFITSGEII